MRRTSVPVPTCHAGVLGLCVAGFLAAGELPAQTLRVERQLHARTMQLRLEVQEAVQQARGAGEIGRILDVAELLAGRDSDPPLQPLLAALARLRGRDPAPTEVFAAGAIPLVLPSTISQDGDATGLHATLHLPRVLPDSAGDLELAWIDVFVREPETGDLIAHATIDDEIEREDLLRFRATHRLDAAAWTSGRVRVDMVPRFHGVPPPGADALTSLRATVWIVPGYRARASRFAGKDQVATFAELAEQTSDPTALGLVAGAARSVQRVWYGEAPIPDFAPERDLEVTERLAARLVAGEPLLSGLGDPYPIRAGLPLGIAVDGADGKAEVLSARISAGSLRTDALPRPLVVVLPGSPTWDRRASRPAAPKSVDPAWGYAALSRGGLWSASAEDQLPFHLVVLESGGRVGTTGAFSAAVEVLSEHVPIARSSGGTPQIVCVGAREGAFSLSLAVRKDPALASGLVLVDGGILDRSFADAWGTKRPILLFTPGDLVSKERGRSMAQRASSSGLEIRHVADTAPWPVALGLAGTAIASWVKDHF